MEKEVVYVAELDSDVDDVVAAHYLFNEGVLKCVVCDPYPRTLVLCQDLVQVKMRNFSPF